MERLEDLIIYNPRSRFRIPLGDDWSVWDLTEEWQINKSEMLSMGSATPFDGWRVSGRNYLTVCDGIIAYNING
jgi:dihydroorotase-like cyclic amidohydrolase